MMALHGRPVWRLLTAKPLGAASGLILLTMALLALFAGRISPYAPIEVDLRNIRSAPSAEHVLGTDYNGRDVLSRILHGGRISLAVGLLSVVLGTGLGAVWGLVSGYLGVHGFEPEAGRVLGHESGKGQLREKEDTALGRHGGRGGQAAAHRGLHAAQILRDISPGEVEGDGLDI